MPGLYTKRLALCRAWLPAAWKSARQHGESSFLSKTPSVLEVGKQALNADHPSHTLLKKFTCIMIEEVLLFRQ